MSSGISVLFIQKPPLVASGKRKTMPASGASDVRCISPRSRCGPVLAISTCTTTSAAPVSIRAVPWGSPGAREGASRKAAAAPATSTAPSTAAATR
jgi:hypothetical protein